MNEAKANILLDENNVAYLDMVNNVCHVGHCHPKVVEAGQKQMAMLNTNTRYLNNNIIEYSEALLSKMPDELSVVMFVNSGSEANELAMRLMHCATTNLMSSLLLMAHITVIPTKRLRSALINLMALVATALQIIFILCLCQIPIAVSLKA